MKLTINNCTIVGAAAFASITQVYAQDKTGPQPVRPNVIFFLVDDLGWSDVGCFGSSFYETPNIDKLADEGMRFTQAYAACHVSSPTRASIMTGRYPASINLTDWLPGRGNHPFQRLLNNVTVQQLPPNEETIAETLRSNGYKTAIIGKWHIGTGEYGPLKRGFDIHIPSQYEVGWPRGYHYPFRMNGYDGNPGEYLTDRLTDEALSYIEQNAENPFFLYMAHFAVHDPVQGRKDLVEKYRKKLLSMPECDSDRYILEGNPDDKNPLSRKQLDELMKTEDYREYKVLPGRTVKIKQRQDNIEFAAMVESMDESLGRIVSKLSELGIEQNTIVIFVSDNGGMSAANLNNPKRVINPNELDKEFPTSNLPLRGSKGWMYEGGIRVPMVVKYPGVTRGGTVCETPVVSNDFYSTIVEMTDAEVPKGKTTEGVSIVPLLKNKKIKDRPLFWHFPHYSNHGMQSPGGAVRYGNYKLIEYFENNTVQLFNLKEDIGEQNDISKTEPKVAERLRKMLHSWRKKIGVKSMIPNPDYVEHINK